MSLGQGRFIEMRLKREILQERANKKKKETDEEILLRDPDIFRNKNDLQFYLNNNWLNVHRDNAKLQRYTLL